MKRYFAIIFILVNGFNSKSQEINSVPINESMIYLIKGKDTFLLQKVKTTDTLKGISTTSDLLNNDQVRGRLIEILIRDGEVDTLKNKDLSFRDNKFVDFYRDSTRCNYYQIEPLTSKAYFQRQIQVRTSTGYVSFSFLYGSSEEYDCIVNFILTDLMKETDPSKVLHYKKDLFLTAK